MAKREREKIRQERQEAKRLRREALALEPTPDPADEARLMDEFRLLSERHARGGVSEMTYETERRRIFVELGIEKSED